MLSFPTFLYLMCHFFSRAHFKIFLFTFSVVSFCFCFFFYFVFIILTESACVLFLVALGKHFFACLHHFLPGGHLHAGGLWVTGAQYVSNDRFFPRPPLWHFSACLFSQLLLSCHLQNHSFIVCSSTLLLFYFDSLVSCFFLFLIIFYLLFSLFFNPNFLRLVA